MNTLTLNFNELCGRRDALDDLLQHDDISKTTRKEFIELKNNVEIDIGSLLDANEGVIL